MITRFRVTNFRSLGDVEVNLDPVTVLIGRSGTGKSNFVDALRLFRDILRTRSLDHEVNQIGGWDNIMPFHWEKPSSLTFEADFCVSNYSWDFQYLLSFRQAQDSARGNPPRFHEEKLARNGQVIFHQRDNNWLVPPKVTEVPGLGNLVLGTITGLEEASIAHQVLVDGIGCYVFSDQVLMAPTAGVNGHLGFWDRGGNFLGTLQAISKNLKLRVNLRQIAAALRTIDSSLSAIDLAMPDMSRVVLTHQEKDKNKVIDLKSKSEGFRRFLAHLLALYQVPSKQTLVFEEPEKGIHPGALEALAEQFKACPEAGRGQVLLTTHSPVLLDNFDPDNLRVVEIEDMQTKIGPVAPDQVESIREHLMKPGELLTVYDARLASVGAS